MSELGEHAESTKGSRGTAGPTGLESHEDDSPDRAVGLFLGSPAVVLYALCGGPLWNLLVRPWEERDLEQRFGESFVRYRQAVRCWWPHFRPYTH